MVYVIDPETLVLILMPITAVMVCLYSDIKDIKQRLDRLEL